MSLALPADPSESARESAGSDPISQSCKGVGDIAPAEVRKLRDTLGIAISDMIFIGDAIFPGGNDYPAKQAGAISICVRDPEETKRVVEAIIACLRWAKKC